jgi:hypothetical protein|tara:strand:- start:168 stop:545 length:378 start_codon:yes stop_codon:yes gene_type:complete
MKASDEDETVAPEGHNSEGAEEATPEKANGRKPLSKKGEQTVRSVVKNCLALKEQIKELNSAMRQEKGRAKALGLKVTDLNFAMRLYELEGDDRDEALFGIQSCCKALDVGQQGSLFPEATATLE